MPTTSPTKAANKAAAAKRPGSAKPAPSTSKRTITRGSATPRIHAERASKVAASKQKLDDLKAREAHEEAARERLANLSAEDRETAKAHTNLTPAERAKVTEGAKQEAALVAEAEKAGQPRPETPSLAMLEAVHRAKDAGFTPRRSSEQAKARQPKAEANPQTVHYTVDGKPVAPTQNRLSSISRVTATKDAARWPAPELRSWLVAQGIADPEHTAWDATLPNGRKIGAVLAEQAEARAS